MRIGVQGVCSVCLLACKGCPLVWIGACCVLLDQTGWWCGGGCRGQGLHCCSEGDTNHRVSTTKEESGARREPITGVKKAHLVFGIQGTSRFCIGGWG